MDNLSFAPFSRLRRIRDNEGLRRLVRETELSLSHIVYPVFVVPGKKVRKEINAMPGQYHLSVDVLATHIEPILKGGIKAVLLFGSPDKKSPLATEAYSKGNCVNKAIKELKKNFPDLVVITDVCLCAYTTHGHCGIIKGNTIQNDVTLEILSKAALSHAEAGVDMVAPSDMMDGRVWAIRSTLDTNGFGYIPIMSYSTKFASAFYGPFREAADSAPQFGDRRGYQMDPANAREAVRESLEDENEGADILMVKPALAYLDIITRLRQTTHLPVAAYNVSGEYSMVKAAAQKGWIDEKKVVLEILTSIKRAGADIIITYHAPELVNYLKGQ